MRTKNAFTLVELLVVMVVIGVLIGLLLPAIAGAIRSARAATVTAEINNLATALSQFKSTYGDYPPSRIFLIESGNYATTSTAAIGNAAPVQTDINLGQLQQRTVRYMSKFFPRATGFSTTGGGIPVDYNGDGTTANEFYYLDGSECLVFFLGGMPSMPIVNNPGQAIGMSGFSRNPANPFVYTSASTSRTQPLYEFKSDRLVDIDGDGFPSYFDTLSVGSNGRPFAYFSAYGTNSYDPNDCNLAASDQVGQSLGDNLSRVFEVNFGVNSSALNGGIYASLPPLPWPQVPVQPVACVSPSPNPYTTSQAVPFDTKSGHPVIAPVTWANPQSFQLISAGSDQLFGVGGQWAGGNPTNRLSLPASETPPMWPTEWSGGVVGGPVVDQLRHVEYDNLTNFSSSRLNQ